MERPLCVRSSQNQAARIRLIVGVFLDNLANKESLKNFVNTDYSERFGFHLSTRMFGESAIPQTGSNLGIIHATTLNHVAQIYHLLGLSSWSGVPVDTVDGERCTAPSRSKVGSPEKQSQGSFSLALDTAFLGCPPESSGAFPFSVFALRQSVIARPVGMSSHVGSLEPRVG